jgi:hypothetical protein
MKFRRNLLVPPPEFKCFDTKYSTARSSALPRFDVSLMLHTEGRNARPSPLRIFVQNRAIRLCWKGVGVATSGGRVREEAKWAVV